MLLDEWAVLKAGSKLRATGVLNCVNSKVKYQKNKHTFAVIQQSQLWLKKTHTGYARQVTDALQQIIKFFGFLISFDLIIVWQKLPCIYCKLFWFHAISNHIFSLFTNINKFQSISNILDSLLDLFCD